MCCVGTMYLSRGLCKDYIRGISGGLCLEAPFFEASSHRTDVRT